MEILFFKLNYYFFKALPLIVGGIVVIGGIVAVYFIFKALGWIGEMVTDPYGEKKEQRKSRFKR